MAKIIPKDSVGYVTPAVLQKEVARLSAFKANKDGSYTIDGTRLTPAQRNSVISDAESKVSNAKKGEETSPKLETAKTSRNVLNDLKADLSKIDSSRSALENKKGSTKNVKDFDLLNSWIRYYDKIKLDVSAAIQSAESGSFVDRIEVQFANTGSADSWKSSQPPFTPVVTPVTTPSTTRVGDMFKTQPTGEKNVGSMTDTKLGSGTVPELDLSGFSSKTPAGGTPTGKTPTGKTPTGKTPTGGTPDLSGVNWQDLGKLMGIPPDWKTAAQEEYGQYYGIIESFPEIAILIQQASEGKWPDDKFFAKLGTRFQIANGG